MKSMDPRATKHDHMELMDRLQTASRHRRPWERDWYLNLAYLNNEQDVAFVPETGTLLSRIESADADDDASVHNVMMKIARTERSKILRTKPRPTAMPANLDDESYTTARVLEAYFDQLTWEWDFSRKMRHGVYWLVATGNVFYKWYWDDGPQMEVVPPFEMYPDPYVREFEQSRWVIHSRFYDLETAWDMYADESGANTEHLSHTSTHPLNPLENRIYSDIGSTSANLEGVNVYEYWQPPSGPDYPGCWYVFTDAGIVLEKHDYPYEHGELPFTHTTHVVRSTTKWAASVLDYMRPMQDELNRSESQNMQNRVLMNGKWWIPSDLELEADPNGEPRQNLRGTGPPGVKPEFIQPSGYPAWAGESPQYWKSQMQDLAGQHEVSNAGVPGRVESGQAIQLLQESDDQMIRDAIDSHEEAIARGFWQSAALHKQYGDAEILVRAYDENGAMAVRQLYKDKIDLKFRVRVQTTTALPLSLAGKSDRVLNWLQYGVVNPEQAAELLDLSQENPSLLPNLRDKLNAMQENYRMREGEEAFPNEFDDHNTHIKHHHEYMKSEEYRLFDPDQQEIFIQHVDVHKELRKALYAEEAELMGIQQGMALGAPVEPAEGTPPPAEQLAPPTPAEGVGPQPPTMTKGNA